MQPLSGREKVLITSNVLLAVLVVFLLYKVIDYNLNVFEVKHDFSAPPTMEESIKSANLIFKCANKISGGTLECFIEDIIFKDASSDFPFEVGDSYLPMKSKTENNTQYGSGNVVLLSPKSRISKRSVPIYNGILRGFDNITVQEFINTVNKIKKTS